MIFGVGTDLVEIKRIHEMKSYESFAIKILSEEELFVFNELSKPKKVNYLSKQFAGKEAFAKAFGTGIRKDLNFKAIKILRDNLGKPFFEFDSSLQMVIDDFGITRSHVSLSDESGYALAFVILEK